MVNQQQNDRSPLREQSGVHSNHVLEGADRKIVQMTGNGVKYETYWYRWVIVALFFLIGHNNSLFFSNMGYFPPQLHAVYDIPENMVIILLTGLNYAMYFVGIWPALYFANRKDGLYYSANAAAWLMLIGQILRMSQPSGSYTVMLVGSLIGFLNTPFLLGSFTQLSKNWFPVHERSLATGLCVLGNQFGMVTPTLFMRLVPDAVDDVAALEAGLLKLNIATIILTGVSAILTLFFFRARAPTPPSPETESHDISFKKSMRVCLSNWRFLLVSVTFGIVGPWLWDAGVMNSSIFSSIPGYTADATSTLVTVMTAVSIIGIFLAGYVLDRTHEYYWSSVVLIGVATAASGIMVHVSGLDYSEANYGLVFFFACLFTFCLGGAETLLLELGAELSFPAREMHSGLIMYAMTQVFGLFQLFTSGTGYLFEGDALKVGYLFTGILAFALLCFVITYGFTLKRAEAEAKKTKRDVRPRLSSIEQGEGAGPIDTRKDSSDSSVN